MRIDKFLVSQNICTRKEAQKLVRKGLVKIDSEIVKKPETKLDPNVNKVTVDGKEISYQEYVYIISLRVIFLQVMIKMQKLLLTLCQRK